MRLYGILLQENGSQCSVNKTLLYSLKLTFIVSSAAPLSQPLENLYKGAPFWQAAKVIKNQWQRMKITTNWDIMLPEN